jgi:hypothetical protein
MQYNVLSNRKRAYGVKTYMVDTLAEIDDIPLTLASTVPGSIAIVAETGEKYILNLKRQWELIGSSSSSSGGDSGDINYEGGDLMDEISDDSDINYDGGVLA